MFGQNPFLPIVIAIASIVSALPLGVLVAGNDHLLESGFVVAVVGLVGLIGALLRIGRGTTFLLQLLSGIAMLVWRATTLAPGVDIVDVVPQLVQAGATTISESSPPMAASPGITFLVMALIFLTQMVLELLVTLLEQPAWSFAPIMLSYLIAGIAGPEELSLTTFAAVAGSFVLVLLAATGIGEGHRAASASRQGSFHLTRTVLAALLAAGGIAGAAAIQPLLPMGEKQPWQQTQQGPIQLGDPTVALNENLLRPDNQPVFSYKTSDGKPIYFRTVALPDLTSDGVRLVPMKLRTNGLDRAYDAPGVDIEVDVRMRDVPSEYLPVPFAVDQFEADGEWSFDPDTLSVVATGPDRLDQTVGLTYSASSTVPAPSMEDLDAADAGNDVDPITQVIPEVDQRVVDITKEVVADAETAGQKAQAIQDFLRSDEFEYSLEAPQTATLDVISSFLVDERSGYCIHYASAMMTMARIEGIPSRMAVGFNSGSKQSDGSYLVTSHNMHAWPELYFDGLGWVAFEPTPSVASPPGYTHADPGQEGSAPPAPPSPSPEASESPSPEPSESPSDTIEEKGGKDTEVVEKKSPAKDPLPAWVLPTVLGTLGLLVLLTLPMLVRSFIGRWRLRSGQEPAALAASAWREVHATFVDTGRPWPEGSPGPAARSVADSVPNNSLLMGVAGVVERATFARDAGDVSTLPDMVRQLRKDLRKHSKWWTRWWPRSLWRR